MPDLVDFCSFGSGSSILSRNSVVVVFLRLARVFEPVPVSEKIQRGSFNGTCQSIDQLFDSGKSRPMFPSALAAELV